MSGMKCDHIEIYRVKLCARVFVDNIRFLCHQYRSEILIWQVRFVP